MGPGGLVVGVDPAPRTYGSPTNLGQSTDHMMSLPAYRDRLRFLLEVDPLSPKLGDLVSDAVAEALGKEKSLSRVIEEKGLAVALIHCSW